MTRPLIVPTPEPPGYPANATGARFEWCRWPDSNRHGLRHCPLKTACLPIPPHRPDESCTRFHSPPVSGADGSLSPKPSSSGRTGNASIDSAVSSSEDSTLEISVSEEAGSSIRLVATGRLNPMYASARLDAKNKVANTAVERERKLADPLAPNTVPEAPDPKAAPASAPFPRCSRTSPIISADMQT